MSDPAHLGGVVTNGNGAVAHVETPAPVETNLGFSTSVDERLESLRQTIRAWDWRAGLGDQLGAAAATAGTETTTLDPTAVPDDSRTEAAAVPADTDEHASENVLLTPLVVPDTETQPIAVEPPTVQVETVEPAPDTTEPASRETSDSEAPHASVTLDPAPALTVADDAEDAASWFTSQAEAQAEPERRVAGLWSHPRTKAVTLGIAAVLAVVLIIGGIRLFSNANDSAPPARTNSSARTATHAPRQPRVVAPITAAELAQYGQYSRTLAAANSAVTNALVGAGSSPTKIQVGAAVSSYRTAIDLYNLQLHVIQWPVSMQAAIQTEYGQLQALSSFLESFGFVSPTGVSAWLTQLHNRTSTTQAADNQVRQDLGLPATATFP